MTKLTKNSITDSVLAVAYIFLVVFFINSAQGIFGDGKTVLIPMAMLILFVFSAAVTGSLVFGRSVLWYMDGQKKEAIMLVVYKLVVMLVAFAIVLFAAYLTH